MLNQVPRSLSWLLALSIVVVACGDDDDDTSTATGGGAGRASGGSAGSKATTGGTSAGGSSSKGGTVGTTGGATPTTGGATPTSGGAITSGGSPNGGAATTGGVSDGGTPGTTGGTSTGGVAGGAGGEGGFPEGGTPGGGAGGAPEGGTAGQPAGGTGGGEEGGAGGSGPVVISDTLDNAGFETGNEGNTIPGWTVTGATPTAAHLHYMDSEAYHPPSEPTPHNTFGLLNLWMSPPVAYTVTVSQEVSPLANGNYSFSIWHQGALYTDQKVFARGYDANNASAELSVAVVEHGAYTEIVVFPIPVTSGKVEVGVYSDAASGNWGHFDYATLTKLP